jgi:uncharacterized OsmC-like protein
MPREVPAASTPGTRTEPSGRNGVDVANLLDAVTMLGSRPDFAQFRFRATSRWVVGAHSHTTIERFSGAGGHHAHTRPLAYDADHPQVLAGADQGPTPIEFLLLALGAGIVAGVAIVATARGVALTAAEARVECDVDLRGVSGLADGVRNGCQAIRVDFRIAGDAPPETLREIVVESTARSAVFDVVRNGTSVSVDVTA